MLPSQLQVQPNDTAWWQRHIYADNLPKVVTRKLTSWGSNLCSFELRDQCSNHCTSLLIAVGRVRGRCRMLSPRQWHRDISRTCCCSLSPASSTRHPRPSVTQAATMSLSPTDGVARLSSMPTNLTSRWWAALQHIGHVMVLKCSFDLHDLSHTPTHTVSVLMVFLSGVIWDCVGFPRTEHIRTVFPKRQHTCAHTQP